LDGDLIFYVEDTGIGIGRESVVSIFDHFVKEDHARSRASEGSGLGLSISRGIAELLGGELKAESEKGKGSIFSFTLPVSERAGDNRNAKNARSGGKNKKLSSILVAEDDSVNFLYIKTLLRKITGAEIIHAINGREAIEKFINNPTVDIILMDMKMPEIDGFEATRKIKSINPEIPIIAVTAYAMIGDEKRILEAGCDEYLCKPISKNLLLEKMSRFVSV
jgi:CheY-like chemotaxis protein